MSRSTKILLNTALFLASVLMIVLMRDVLSPIFNTLSFLVVPFVLSVYIYYALKPLKEFFLKYIDSNNLVTALVFIAFLALLILLAVLIGNILVDQIYELVNDVNLYDIYRENRGWIDRFGEYIELDKWLSELSRKFQEFMIDIPNRLTDIADSITRFATQFILMIFAIFYFLKDGGLIRQTINKQAEGPYGPEIRDAANHINEILETYISGQMLVSLILGIFTFAGYMIIGLPGALLLAMIALITNLIPYIGPFIGAAPAVLIGLTEGPVMAFQVILVNVIVQQVEANLVSPNIIGQKLDIHPLVVMVVVLVCMRLFGVLGALIATPLYLILVTIIKTIHKMYYKSKNMNYIPAAEASAREEKEA